MGSHGIRSPPEQGGGCMTVLLLNGLGVVTYDRGVIMLNTSIHSLECPEDITNL